VYAALADPDGWAFDPDRIARLTDWQIENVYLGPAARRAKEREGGAEPEPEPERPRQELTREGYIRAARNLFGGSADDWGRKWDEAKERDEQDRRRPPA